MMGSEAPRDRKTANQLGASQAPAHEHWPDLARPRMLSSAGRDFVIVSFFEGETDGFETN